MSRTSEPLRTQVSTRLLLRLVIVLIAAWNLVAGGVLVGLGGAGAGALGAGVADTAGQRLVGAHLLVLAPAYLILAWQPERYALLLWLPFAAQVAVVGAIGYSIVSGATSFGDGILPLAIAAMFTALLVFVWVQEQRGAARLKLESRGVDAASDDEASGGEQP